MSAVATGVPELAVRLRSVAHLDDLLARRGGAGAAGPLGEPLYEPDGQGQAFEGWTEGLTHLERALGPLHPGRVYVGTEFCEHLLPTPAQVAAEVAEAESRQVALTLLTPPLTEAGLARVVELARELRPQDELVVNDWGVLEALAGSAPLVLGRCLVKFHKDPAVVASYSEGSAPDSLAPLRLSALATAALRARLVDSGVTRLEVDALPQGFPADLVGQDLAASVHLPYGYVSTGRVCLVGSLSLPRPQRFTPQTSCVRPCEGLEAEMRACSREVEGEPAERLFLKGNTTFFHLGWARAADYALEAIAAGVDRVVLSPRPEG